MGGARALVQATDFCRRTGGTVELVGASLVVQRVLSACGFDELFELDPGLG